MKVPDKLSEKLKYYFSICCISFTILELVLSISNVAFDMMSSNLWINNIELFAICLCIALLMFITDRFTKNTSKLVFILVDLIDVCVSVFGLGGFAFHMFDITGYEVLFVFCVLIVVYFAVYGIMLLNGKITADIINKKILERKGERENDREDN